MDVIVEFAKLMIPAGLVLYAMYVTVKTFVMRDLQKQTIEVKRKNVETVLPIRLQAYERMTLFLERISPQQLLPRVSEPDDMASRLQEKLLFEIREEYGHNLSQQVYISENAWHLIKNAKEDVISNINRAADMLPDDATGIQLSRKIFELALDQNVDHISYALNTIKEEVRQFFG